MENLPRQKLCELITKYGKDLHQDSRRCEALLRDFCGQSSSEISVLVGALREGVASELSSSTPQAISTEVLLHRLSHRLQDNLYLQPEAADWAIDSWAIALGVLDQPRPISTPAPIDNSLAPNNPPANNLPADLPEELPSQPSQKHRSLQAALMGLVLLALSGFSIWQYQVNQDLKRTNRMQAENLTDASQASLKQNRELETSSSQIKNLEDQIQDKDQELQDANQKNENIYKDIEENDKKDAQPNTHYFKLINSCSRPIRFAIRYKDSDQNWQDESWWNFNPSEESGHLSVQQDEKIQISHPLIYYYVEATEGNKIEWNGYKSVRIGDKNYLMRAQVLQINSDDDFTLNFSC